MSRHRLRFIITLSALTVALTVVSAHGQSDKAATRSELDDVTAAINRVTQEIEGARTRKSALEAQVRKAEVELGEVQRSIRDNRSALKSTNETLDALAARQLDLETARNAQQVRIAKELRSAWQVGQQGQFQVLLSQESPDTVARNLTYHRYLFAARNELLVDYRQTLSELADLEVRQLAAVEQLEQEQSSLDEAEKQLAKAKETRQLAVAKLSADIASKGTELKRMEENRAQLERLLTTIEEAVSDLQAPEDYQAFAEARGKMSWPVLGKPSNRFGRPRNAGKMRWQGVNIPAPAGATVTAIHQGRVVYADWFRGSGLLLIIDHGDGFMSLYAHNQALLREVGEWVRAGTSITTVGDSGGLNRPALYFEIRKDGKPTNPANWCKG
ncbi:MAG: peptidoglycan DD-metalloendopeptidase family protein [Halioglobus sp.]